MIEFYEVDVDGILRQAADLRRQLASEVNDVRPRPQQRPSAPVTELPGDHGRTYGRSPTR